MIKILKEGIVPKKYKTIFKTYCENCCCEFEFEIEDCESVERSLTGNLTIKCPCCNNVIIRNKLSSLLNATLTSREVEEDEI